MPKNRNRKDDRDKPVSQREFTKIKKVIPRNEHQALYLDSVENNTLTIASGPAGTGKTHLAVYEAICHHFSKKYKRIIITRPAIEAGGEKLGFLPGELQDKLDPYLRPIFDSLYELIGVDQTREKIQRGYIEIAPLAYMRGRTFTNCFVILDEAQNATLEQLEMAVTRIGEGSKMVINGDPKQTDLPGKNRNSGLKILQEIARDVPDVSVIEFEAGDIVRSEVVTHLVKAFAKYEEERNE